MSCATSCRGGCAGFEFILVNAHGGLFVGTSHDHAFDDKSQAYAIIQKNRPVDGGFDQLPRRESFGGCKKQARAADVQALAGNDPTRVSTLYPAAFDCHPE